MEIKIKSVLAAVPKDVDDTGRIVGFKKFAGRAAVVVILDNPLVQQTGDFASIPIGDRHGDQTWCIDGIYTKSGEE